MGWLNKFGFDGCDPQAAENVFEDDDGGDVNAPNPLAVGWAAPNPPNGVELPKPEPKTGPEATGTGGEEEPKED